jgi:hypothetical protein
MSSVFGAPLPRDPAALEGGVPRFVYRAVAYLLQHGLGSEGLFRLAGSVAQVRSLCAAYDRGEDPDLAVRWGMSVQQARLRADERP